MLTGCGCYLVGTIAVTIGYSVPLNDALARLSLTEPTASQEWTHYVRRWTAWNHVRTGSAIAAAAAFTLALATRPR